MYGRIVATSGHRGEHEKPRRVLISAQKVPKVREPVISEESEDSYEYDEYDEYDEMQMQNVGVALKAGVKLIPLIYKTPKPSCFLEKEGDTQKRTLRDNVIVNQMLDVYTGHAYESGVKDGTHWYCPYNYYFNGDLPEGIKNAEVSPQEAKELIDSGVSPDVFQGCIKWDYVSTSRNVSSYFNDSLQLYNGGQERPQIYRFISEGENPTTLYFMTVKRVKQLFTKICNFNQNPVSDPDTADDKNWTAALYRAFAFDIICWEEGQTSCIAAANSKEINSAELWLAEDQKTALSPMLIDGVGN